MSVLTIYGNITSGNCLKVKWTAEFLGLDFNWIEIDVPNGEAARTEFSTRFPMAQVPVVEFADKRILAQSNAIIRYLARDSELLPADPFTQAKIDEWLFWEQYSHEPYIAVCRFHMVYRGLPIADREPWRVERGTKALALMQQHLSVNKWLVGGIFTIADISLLAYTRVAHEGGFDLKPYAAIRDWVSRSENQLKLSCAA